MGNADVQLHVVGVFTVRRAGRPLERVEVGSRKARTLLALLAVTPRRTVGVDRIIDALWAGSPPRRPVENVATLVSRLRARLGPRVIRGDSVTGYQLGTDVRIDLRDASALAEEAESRIANGEPLLGLSAGRRALAILDAGVALADAFHADWAEPVRSAQADLLRRARHATAYAGLAVGDLSTARAAAESAIEADPFDEAACRAAMRGYAAEGEPARALLLYERLRTTLAEELGVDPAPASRDLHHAILCNESTATLAPVEAATVALLDA